VQATVMTASVLSAYWLAMNRQPGNVAYAQTVAFVTLAMSELLRAFTARSQRYSVFSIGLFSNRWMVWATGCSSAVILLGVYVPFLRPFFDTVPLGFDDWVIMLPFIFSNAIAAEITKVFLRRRAIGQRPVRAGEARGLGGTGRTGDGKEMPAIRQ
jgi:P-type Ca2+ transporter type 2C